MLKAFGVLVVGVMGGVVGCAADEGADSAATDTALEKNVDARFRPVTGCSKKDYIGEIDFTDHRHPRYRIRHSDRSRGAEVGKQNIGLINARGNTFPTRGWISPDTLVSVYSDMSTPALRTESDRTVPWRDLPVSDEFLGVAFDGEGVHLERAEIRFNFPYRMDPFCRASFVDD